MTRPRFSLGRCLATVAAFAACVAVAAGGSFAAERTGANALFQDSDNIHIVDVRQVTSQDNATLGLSEGGATYVIAHIRYTNHTGQDFAPMIDHFVFTATDGSRFFGLDSGSTVLAGISNFHGIVKKDATEEYTIGFRASSIVTGGTINYEISD